ncbi:MAG TPA: TIM barrel protein [Pirellulales bacterium]|jgi:sugar phosphate isomerase/epimerase|nr:TIM barrel protein [Pirellulales bacterium]
MQVACFIKSFQDMPFDRFCRALYEQGFDGVDLTVRNGGSIEPADVEAKLPAAVNTLHEQGLKFLFLSTDLTAPDATADRVLGTAAQLGIDRIKLGYNRYVPFGTLAKQIDDTRRRLAEMAALGRKHRVLPCVHIHSGTYMSSHGTLLYEVIKDFAPDEIGAYVDPLHMTLEGAGAGWQQGLDLLAPWIALVAVKNFAWHSADRDKSGQMRWRTEVVPLADGVAPLPDFFAMLRKTGYDGTYSLHSEYKGKHSFKDLSTDECLAQTAEDLKYFRSLVSPAERKASAR